MLLIEQYLECTETARKSAVLNIEADGNVIYREIRRRIASS